MKLDTSWIEDISISAINSASTKDEVREVWDQRGKYLRNGFR